MRDLVDNSVDLFNVDLSWYSVDDSSWSVLDNSSWDIGDDLVCNLVDDSSWNVLDEGFWDLVDDGSCDGKECSFGNLVDDGDWAGNVFDESGGSVSWSCESASVSFAKFCLNGSAKKNSCECFHFEIGRRV